MRKLKVTYSNDGRWEVKNNEGVLASFASSTDAVAYAKQHGTNPIKKLLNQLRKVA